MQHITNAEPRDARNDFAHPEDDFTPMETAALVGAMLLAGVLIGWAVEAVFIAINTPMVG